LQGKLAPAVAALAALSWWLSLIVCHTVLIAFVDNHKRNSILAVLVFDGLMNFTGE
jgi:hypothetical protein